jgi:hypothetical protein
MMAQVTVSNTILQTLVSVEMRGRVISYFAMAFFGMLPLGSFLIGAVSTKVGAPKALLGEGIIALVVAAVFSRYLLTGKFSKKETQNSSDEAILEKA